MSAVVLTDSVGIGNLLVAFAMFLLAVPAGFLALRTWRRENDAQTSRKEAQTFQRQMSAWMDGSQGRIRDIHQQTKPSNGKTLAQIVEEIKTTVEEVDERLDGHMSDGHGGSSE